MNSNTTITRPQMEQEIAIICQPINPAYFRRWLHTLPDYTLVKEYILVSRRRARAEERIAAA